MSGHCVRSFNANKTATQVVLYPGRQISVISRKTPGVEGSAPGLACPGWDSASFLACMYCKFCYLHIVQNVLLSSFNQFKRSETRRETSLTQVSFQTWELFSIPLLVNYFTLQSMIIITSV